MSGYGEAAIDHQFGSGDPPGSIRRKVEDSVRNVLGTTAAQEMGRLERRLGSGHIGHQTKLEEIFQNLGTHLGVDHPGMDRIHANAVVKFRETLKKVQTL